MYGKIKQYNIFMTYTTRWKDRVRFEKRKKEEG
jgi:hypothetical protein